MKTTTGFKVLLRRWGKTPGSRAGRRPCGFLARALLILPDCLSGQHTGSSMSLDPGSIETQMSVQPIRISVNHSKMGNTRPKKISKYAAGKTTLP